MTPYKNGYCKLILAHPKLSFGLTLGCHIVTIIITGILNTSGYDILPLDISELPMQLDNEDIKLQGDAWKFVASDPRVTWTFESGGNKKEALRSSRYDILEVYYQEKDNKNLLTKDNLETIKRFEDTLFNNSVYQKDLCLLDENSAKCKKPLSIIRLFDGTYKNLNPNLYDPDFQNIPKVLALANKMLKSISYHFSKESDITAAVPTASALRTILYTGSPLSGFSSIHDRQNDQLQKCRELAGEAFGETLEKAFNDGVENLKIHYRMSILMMNFIQKQVVWDLLLVAGSFTFIFVFMIIQTQSLWITGWSIFSIFASFFGANIVYRILLDYRYIGIFHVLTVFIIAGIGADDVFVFYDTWRSSKEKGFTSLLERFSYTYNHAAKAMLITSLTTFVAFLTNVFSPLLAVSSFGVFSALIVLVNYISVIIFLPNVLITYELYWKDWTWPCFRCCQNKIDPNDCDEGNESTNEINNEPRLDPSQKIAKFIGKTFYSKVIGHKIVRWIVVVISLGIIAVSISFAVQLVPNDEQIDFMGPGSNWYDVKRIKDNLFASSEEDKYFNAYIAWGLRNQDRSECHFTDYKCPGKTVFDNSFDISIPPCQMAVLELCKDIKTLPDEKLKELKIRRSQVTNTPTVNCFIDAMETYFKQESQKPQYPNGTDFSFPLNANKIQTLLKYNPRLYKMGKISDEYYRYFEVAIAHWITQGNTSYNSNDYKIYKKYIGGALDTTLTPSNVFQGGKYGNKLLYAAITIETSLTLSTLGYREGIKVINSWKSFVEEKMKKFPAACQKAFPTTPEHVNPWHWIKVQEVLVVSAVRGICLSLAVTLPILVIMTGNWIVALLCMLSITCTTCGVIGMIPLAGWKLGVLESLNLTLVVGLAVDYVVHLAEGYVTCSEASRPARVKHTLRHVGISVLSGACTTLGAAVFMLAAKILFFFQFAIFIFCTIAFSLMFSFFFFMTLLALVGPQGTTGSLQKLYVYIHDKVRGKKPTDTVCCNCDGKGFHNVKNGHAQSNNNTENIVPIG